MIKLLLTFTFFAIATLGFLSQSSAGVWGGVDGYYNSDSFLADEDATNTSMFVSADVFANLTSKYTTYAGFHVHQLSTTSDVDGASPNSFSTLDMGPMFMWVIDRKGIYSLSMAYNFLANATNDSGTSAEWSGSSFLVSFGITPEISESWYVGLKLNYYSATYTKETIGSSVSDVSHTRNMIFPTLTLTYRK